MRNRSMKSATRTYALKAEKLINSNELELAQAAVLDTISILDKAAKKKVIHPNTAGRRKSRLMKKLNKAKISAAGKIEATDTVKKTRKKQNKE
jgi:small subunit ribosomal protein S20